MSNFCSKPTPIHGPLHISELFFHTEEDTSVGYQNTFLEDLSIFYHTKFCMIIR